MSFQLNPLMEGKIGNFLSKQGLTSKRQARKIRKQAAKALKDIRRGDNYTRYSIGGHGSLTSGPSRNDYLRKSNDARKMQDFIYNHLKGNDSWVPSKKLTRVMGD